MKTIDDWKDELDRVRNEQLEKFDELVFSLIEKYGITRENFKKNIYRIQIHVTKINYNGRTQSIYLDDELIIIISETMSISSIDNSIKGKTEYEVVYDKLEEQKNGRNV